MKLHNSVSDAGVLVVTSLKEKKNSEELQNHVHANKNHSSSQKLLFCLNMGIPPSYCPDTYKDFLASPKHPVCNNYILFLYFKRIQEENHFLHLWPQVTIDLSYVCNYVPYLWQSWLPCVGCAF